MANAITIDGHFLPKPVNELFHKHELHAVPFMTGANDDEGGWFLGLVSVNAKLRQIHSPFKNVCFCLKC